MRKLSARRIEWLPGWEGDRENNVPAARWEFDLTDDWQWISFASDWTGLEKMICAFRRTHAPAFNIHIRKYSVNSRVGGEAAYKPLSSVRDERQSVERGERRHTRTHTLAQAADRKRNWVPGWWWQMCARGSRRKHTVQDGEAGLSWMVRRSRNTTTHIFITYALLRMQMDFHSRLFVARHQPYTHTHSHAHTQTRRGIHKSTPSIGSTSAAPLGFAKFIVAPFFTLLFPPL